MLNEIAEIRKKPYAAVKLIRELQLILPQHTSFLYSLISHNAAESAQTTSNKIAISTTCTVSYLFIYLFV